METSSIKGSCFNLLYFFSSLLNSLDGWILAIHKPLRDYQDFLEGLVISHQCGLSQKHFSMQNKSNVDKSTTSKHTNMIL